MQWPSSFWTFVTYLLTYLIELTTAGCSFFAFDASSLLFAYEEARLVCKKVPLWRSLEVSLETHEDEKVPLRRSLEVSVETREDAAQPTV